MKPSVALAIRNFAARREDEGYLSDADSFQVLGSVKPKPFSYTEKYAKEQFFSAEYDFREIQVAQHSDGYFSRSIRKKVNRLMVAGFTISSKDSDKADYVKMRLREIAGATNIPTSMMVYSHLFDLARYNNCIVVKTRSENKSSAKPRKLPSGAEMQPVAGYHVLPIETLRFRAKANGELIEAKQLMPTGSEKIFPAKDIVHFCTNRSPGFFLGTPELIPAIDDIQILRRVEENIQDLIETNLFPVFHYTVGTDEMPERISPDGIKETSKVAHKVKHMPPGGVLVTDHRHKIQAIGSEGRSLRIDYYIDHFKSRAFASLGTSALDMGEGDSANRSTASTLSKGMLLDIEALAIEYAIQFNAYVIDEILLEGGYDIFDEEDKVSIRFGVIDKEERRADENQIIQKWAANLMTVEEAKIALGDRPFSEEDLKRTHHALFGEPAALLKSATIPFAAGEALANAPASNITPQAVKKEEKRGEEEMKIQKQAAQATAKAKTAAAKAKSGRPATKKSKTNANKTRPSNQHGTRAAAKTTRDVEFPGEQRIIVSDDLTEKPEFQAWKEMVWNRYQLMKDTYDDLQAIADSMLWRIQDEE
jgi:hypothetical protein